MKKVISVLLVVCIAFLAGYTGGMLAMNGDGIQLNVFGQKVNVQDESSSLSSAGATSTSSVTINVSEDTTVAEAIAEKVLPAVVGVTTTYEYTSSYSNSFFGGWSFGGGYSQVQEASSVGTGFIVDEAGYILTNSHVVNDGDYKTISISLYDGRTVDGTVLWNDSTLDIAVIKIEADNLTSVELGDSDTLKIGSYAAVIGNPLGLAFERSMSQGIISGLDRTISVSDSSSSYTTTMENLIQTDATINSGNSGGPLLNAKGQVVGITSAKASSGEGMGFAIPINTAKPIIEQIKATGTFTRGYIGISGASLETSSYSESQLEQMFGVSSGIYVSSITENGGAEEAGLQKGDVITAIDGTAVGTMYKLNKILITHTAGDVVTLDYVRNGVTSQVQVTLH